MQWVPDKLGCDGKQANPTGEQQSECAEAEAEGVFGMKIRAMYRLIEKRMTRTMRLYGACMRWCPPLPLSTDPGSERITRWLRNSHRLDAINRKWGYADERRVDLLQDAE